MNAASLPPPPSSTPPLPPTPPPPPRRARRTLRRFDCPDLLWTRFEARARSLGCSVDWLLAEAMKRLLDTSLPIPPPAMPSIALVGGGARVVVDRDRVVIGRSGKEANLVLRHPAVSRQHAIVERLGAIFFVVDVGSTNGVVLNGRRVARAIIGPGDLLEVGPFKIVVERV